MTTPVDSGRRARRGRDGRRDGRHDGRSWRTCAAPLVAAAIVVAVAVVLASSDHQLVRVPGFLPAWLATSISCSAVTAVLLLGRSRGGASPRLVVLAAGYLWLAVMTAGLSLSLPDIVTVRPVISDADATWWFWIGNHLVLPVCIAFALVPWPARWRSADQYVPADKRAVHHRLLTRVLAPIMVSAVALTLLAAAAPSRFPTISESNGSGGTQLLDGVLVVVIGVNALAVIAAVAGLAVRRSQSSLETWAAVAAVAFLGNVVVVGTHPPAYTVGFYASRALGLAASVAVLAVLLRDLFALHRNTAQDAARLEKQNRELRDAARLRDHLIAVVSHEMRTPLAGLQGYLELMSEDLTRAIGLEPEDTARMLDRSWLLTRRLTLLTEDLVTVATVENGELAVILETVNLAHQLDECASCFPGLDLRIECAPDLMVRADSLRLQQVLTHLVRNAQKHGAEPVTVTAGVITGTDGDQVSIRVADSGAGVPRDFVHLLFERYSHVGVSGGSGLGLAVVQDLVRAHGGSVRYDLTRPAFVVTLPHPSAPPPPPSQPITAPAGQPQETAINLDDLAATPIDVPDTVWSQLTAELSAGISTQIPDDIASTDRRPAQLSALAVFTAAQAEVPVAD